MFTIFTPTYNRGYIIDKLYKSLVNQSFKDFEWLIIDDGSTDDTKDKIDGYIKDNIIKIRYYFKENEGKHAAINMASDLALGEWFFIVDSDDVLPTDSLEIIAKYCNEVEHDDTFVGVAGNIIHSNNILIGDDINCDYVDMTSADFRKKHDGDKAEVIKTKILKHYKFPVIKNEKFMQESVLWLALSNDGYLIRWFNETVYVADYISDGLTKNGKSAAKNSPKSRSLADNHIVGSKNISFKTRIKSSINYYRYGMYGGISVYDLIKNSNNKFLSVITFPIALLYKIT